MAKKDSIAKAEVASATPRAAGATFQWDGSNGVYRDVGSHTFSAQVQPSFFQAKGPPATEPSASPYWTMGEIGLVPGLSPQAIEWKQAAALATFSLAPVLLASTTVEGTAKLEFVNPLRELFGWQWGMVPHGLRLTGLRVP